MARFVNIAPEGCKTTTTVNLDLVVMVEAYSFGRSTDIPEDRCLYMPTTNNNITEGAVPLTFLEASKLYGPSDIQAVNPDRVRIHFSKRVVVARIAMKEFIRRCKEELLVL